MGCTSLGPLATAIWWTDNLIGLDVTGPPRWATGSTACTWALSDNVIRDNASRPTPWRACSSSRPAGTKCTHNLIGLNQDGDAALGIQGYGLDIRSGGNTIGGVMGEDTNVISGNVSGGVLLFGASATGNTVSGNLIGTDIDGLADVGNLGAGVVISGSSDNLIAGNVISGNNLQGVYVTGTDNTIQGNTIGLDAAGTAALPNSNFGVYLAGANNRVGGTGPGEGNTISGNEPQWRAHPRCRGHGQPWSKAIGSEPTPRAMRPWATPAMGSMSGRPTTRSAATRPKPAT
jgi:parallel beta-helix repeat protein